MKGPRQCVADYYCLEIRNKFILEKVKKYWPDINEEITFGDIIVKYVSREVFSNIVFRKFIIYCGQSERKIEHLHFTTCAEHDVPMYPQNLVVLLQRLLKISYSTQSTIVVYSSFIYNHSLRYFLAHGCL